MRIPFDKIYRAFPELDQFTDEQCAGYVREAREQHGQIVRAWGAAGVLAFIPGLLVTCVTSMPMAAFFGVSDEHLGLIAFGLVLLIGGVASGCASMALRDVGLRRAIAKRLEGARCPKCMYSLLGLSVRAGDVLCPECGHVEHLADRGLSVKDILGVEERRPEHGIKG